MHNIRQKAITEALSEALSNFSAEQRDDILSQLNEPDKIASLFDLMWDETQNVSFLMGILALDDSNPTFEHIIEASKVGGDLSIELISRFLQQEA